MKLVSFQAINDAFKPYLIEYQRNQNNTNNLYHYIITNTGGEISMLRHIVFVELDENDNEIGVLKDGYVGGQNVSDIQMQVGQLSKGMPKCRIYELKYEVLYSLINSQKKDG